MTNDASRSFRRDKAPLPGDSPSTPSTPLARRLLLLGRPVSSLTSPRAGGKLLLLLLLFTPFNQVARFLHPPTKSLLHRFHTSSYYSSRPFISVTILSAFKRNIVKLSQSDAWCHNVTVVAIMMLI